MGTLKGYSHPVLVMGAGYDNVAEDASPAGATTMGAAVLMFDALDGTLLKTLPTLKSVSASVAVIDTDYDPSRMQDHLFIAPSLPFLGIVQEAGDTSAHVGGPVVIGAAEGLVLDAAHRNGTRP